MKNKNLETSPKANNKKQQNGETNQQLNQIPIDEQKRKMSKRIKIALLALAAVLLVVGGTIVWLGAYSDLFDSRGTLEGRLYACVTSEECVLVKDGWCGTVVAVNKGKKSEWQSENMRQTEIARQNRQTCKPTLPEYLDVTSFDSVCQQSRCAAQFIDKTAQDEAKIANWQTYRNDEFGFEFRYFLEDWTMLETSNNTVELRSKKETSKLSIYFSGPQDSSSVSADGLTYCGAYPHLCKREAFSFLGEQGAITWRTVQGNSSADISISLENGSTISVWFYTSTDYFDSSYKKTFKDFLSTFRFTPPAP